MVIKSIAVFISILLYSCLFHAQNLPSLQHEKNINATFSILAYDAENQEWGIAVATNNIYVGNSTIYIEPEIGAFSVIAETEPLYAINGLAELKKGISIKEAIEKTRSMDNESHYRQVSGIDAKGHTFAFTGEALKYWKGESNHLFGENYVVMGNQLAANVLEQMAISYENASGPLSERLMESLIAGQEAGGQITGKQSAALVVKGVENEWYNQIDLRIDNSKNPIDDLNRLLNYHYGRIKLNQAIYAINAGNMTLGRERLSKAEVMLQGWNGMYAKLAFAYSLTGNEDKAVSIIENALLENPKWQENLSSFYYLKDNPIIYNLIDVSSFDVKDWNNAIAMLLNLNQLYKALTLATKTIIKYPNSSYTYYLLGKVCLEKKDSENGILNLKKAISLDEDNVEAKKLLQSLIRR